MREFQEAFESTLYTVLPDGDQLLEELVIRLKHPNSKLQEFLQKMRANHWAFLTAWNPFVQQLTDIENVARNAELEKLLQAYPYFHAEGRPLDPTQWKAEASFFVLGISREESIRLGEQFEQQAIVVGRLGEKAELLWVMP